MLPFLARNWFVLVLLLTLGVGMGGASIFQFVVGAKWLRYGVVAVVMFLMAFPIPLSEIQRTLLRPWASLWAIAINYAILPLVAWGVSFAVSNELGLRDGLLIAAATPCTLASAAFWTSRAAGNDAAALMVTMITNLLCFVAMPFWLFVTTGTETRLEGDRLTEMVFQLGVLVVLPMVLAQLVRLLPAVGEFANARKEQLNLAALAGVLTMVFFGAVESGVKLQEILGDNSADQVSAWSVASQVAIAIGCVLAVHLAMVWFGFWSAGALGLARDDQVAVAFAGSQKTLMIGLHVAVTYFTGLAMLPMVAYHVLQLVCDSIIAEQWAAAHAEHEAQAATRDAATPDPPDESPRDGHAA